MPDNLQSQKLTDLLSQLDTLTNWEARPRGEMRINLEPMVDLMARLGNPHEAFRSIHVAGTKGKSSTCALLEAGLSKAGVDVGRYLSPHIDHICERVSINGHPVSEDQLADALESSLQAFRQARAEGTGGKDGTWFDLLTASAFLLFRQCGVEWSVIETGLGGRLDSTNIVPSDVQVITNIELEHTEVLGSTRSQIAYEKAGIIKPGSHVITPLAAYDEAGLVIQNRADELGATIVRPVSRAGNTILERNVSAVRLALDAASVLDSRLGGWRLDDAAIAQAVLPGRMEMRNEYVAGRTVPVVFDGAHVPFNLAAVLNDLGKVMSHRPCIAVVALAKDKDAEGFLRVLQERHIEAIFTTASNQSRSPSEMADLGNRIGLVCTADANPASAYANALKKAAHGSGWVLVTGSLYLVSLVRRAALQAVSIRKAIGADALGILRLLQSVASWLETGPGKLWPASSFQLSDIEQKIERSEVVVLHSEGQLAACMYIEESDEAFWPEAAPGEALYLHKIAVDRRFAGSGLSQMLLDWAADYAKNSGLKFLRLDCAPREKLVGVYTRAGFQRVGEDQVLDGFLVARLQRTLELVP